MKIFKVTMTGADNSINPQDLIEISYNYPFVEWGILLSRNSQGGNRFPSLSWMNELSILSNGRGVNLSGHVCGSYVKEILMGSYRFIAEIGHIWHELQRIQLNTHGQKHQFEKSAVHEFMNFKKEIIFQYDGANKALLDSAIFNGINCSTLFDMSHGAGLLPGEWPKPIEGVKCGYAGGLSPDNIEDQLKLIESNVGDYELWIDMETHVRSNMDQQFDLDKVLAVLEIAKKYVAA